MSSQTKDTASLDATAITRGNCATEQKLFAFKITGKFFCLFEVLKESTTMKHKNQKNIWGVLTVI